jgi:V8-like Glu-specific endopeptidase
MTMNAKWIVAVACLAGAGCASGAAGPGGVEAGLPAAVTGWEGFFPPDLVDDQWLSGRGLPLAADVVLGVMPRVVKLVLDDGPRQAPESELVALEQQYCADPAVVTWNQDRCRALAQRRCEGGECTYNHYGNCSGLLLGGGILVTAAHCVAGLLEHPERQPGSVALTPGPFGRSGSRLALGRIVAGKLDFRHHWVVVDEEKSALDVAAIEVDDGGLRPLPTAQLPPTGGVIFVAGYPRVEARSAADREQAGYALTFGTPAVSFGRVADPNPGDLPLCNVDGRQEHWALARPCPTREIDVDGFTTWTGVITDSPFLASFDTCNGYSGAPVFEREGRVVGINVTVASQTDPRERFDPDGRAVAIPINRALERLGLALAGS